MLIDGRRSVSSEEGTAAVDINTIPTDLVERVEVLTGGASAIYGADGVTGVVNFILKKNLSGFSIRGQGGISQRGDGGNRFVAATYGKNFGDGRGNIALAYEFNDEDRLPVANRHNLVGANAVTFHETPFASGYDRVPLDNIRFNNSSPGGAIDLDGDTIPEYNADGTPFDQGFAVPPYYQQGGDGTLTSRYKGDLLPRITRHIINAIGHYDVSDKLTFYGEAKYAHIKSFSIDQPTFDNQIIIRPDNPFIPASLRAIAATNSLAPLGLDGDGLLLSRDNFDLGERGENITRQTFRTVAGVKGRISPSLSYDLSATWGETKVTNHFIGDEYTDRFFAAVDAVPDGKGGVTCRINLDPTASIDQPFDYYRAFGGTLTFKPGECVPLNLFGSGSPSQQAINFINVNTTNHARLYQLVVSGSISGDFRNLFSLPGGPIGFALGGEYRRERSVSLPDPVLQQGLTFSNVTPPTGGKFHVGELFAELRAPVFKETRFAYALELGAALRLSDYSTVGRTTTWNVNGRYAPIRDISFRGTYAKAVRAPNISELFAAQGQDFEFITDPCDKAHVNLGKASRPANCAALLSSLGVTDPADFKDPNSASISGLLGGNPALSEEKATTWTAGVVLSPTFLRGFNISADWYDIRLKQAINTVDPQQLAELCVDQSSINNVFCQAITRENGGSMPGRILSFIREPENVASFSTSGLDVDLNYQLATAKLGKFNFSVVGNYLHKLSLIGSPGADPTNDRSTPYSPKFQAKTNVTWQFDPVTITYGLSWFDKTLRYTHDEVAGDANLVAPKYLYYKDHWEHDLQIAYDIEKSFQFYVGVNNLADQKPDLGDDSYPTPALGRFFYAGAKANF